MTTIDNAVLELNKGDHVWIEYNHHFPFNLFGKDRFIARYESCDSSQRTFEVERETRSNRVFRLGVSYTLEYDRILTLTRLNPEKLFEVGGEE